MSSALRAQRQLDLVPHPAPKIGPRPGQHPLLQLAGALPGDAELVAEICKPPAPPRKTRETGGLVPFAGLLGRILKKRE